MNRYGRLKWTIRLVYYLVRDFWLYSKPGHEHSFYLGFKNPGETEDIGVLIWACGHHCPAAREMIKGWKSSDS